MPNSFTKKLSEVNLSNLSEVGGKNASLGEMIQALSKKDIKVPGGFVVTASAYQHFLDKTGLKYFIKDTLKDLKVKDLGSLTRKAKTVRDKIVESTFPEDLKLEILNSYKQIQKEYGSNSTFAVRSSATAEDLPGASFAGQHETFLNIKGEQNLLEAIKKAMASLFNDRAISYRADKGFDHFKISLSVGVQKMVRSDLACSGIMFTLDTETGFRERKNLPSLKKAS
ncbi:MAG: Phosphoenolpyruvate synthase [Candidatus Woesebacteria bacterium GW2011_GWB1_38_5b]|uniref:Phosphoenolpyruvate synthase n=1 Tax=Candidatus Woesebacteria bacterium GW2011_GWB1_38_5b TaxID=1618569 RepID=A0A0G0NCD6_9BACT|nr:MAG: Phosphoenolpyruvate synthase [Candidatus Woesebacteria bacterium GW2011_GWB1_38_5b]